MGRSSRLIGNDVFLEDINFNSFRSSKHWVGFFERKNSFSISLIDKAINLTRAFFSKYEDDFFYISALSFDDERETDEEIIKLFNNIYDSAKNESYLKVLSESFQSYLYGEIPLPANSLSIHYNSERFWDISKLIMGHGGVLGQVFFMVNLKLNLLLYPHDNTGFGCLSLGGNNKICKDYLMYIEKEKEFNVVIKS